MNKLLIIIPILLFSLLLGAPSYSGDFNKGMTAAQKGDYATALKLWRPPHAMSKAYRHFYNKAQCNFVDVEAYYRIAERDGWE